MKKAYRILLSIVIIFALIISICVYAIIKFGTDELPPKDDDLKIVRLDIPEKENAFYYLNQAAEKIYWQRKNTAYILSIVDGKNWDTNFVDELLKKNEEVFEYFEQGLACSNLQVPEITGFDTDISYVSHWRKIARLNSIHAMSLFRSGKEKEAFDEIMKIIKFGHMIEGCKGSIIHYLVGMDVKGTGLNRLRKMLSYTTLESELLLSYIKNLAQYKAYQKGLVDVIKTEYLIDSNTIDALIRTGRDSGERFLKLAEVELSPIFKKFSLEYLFQPNRTKRLFAELHRSTLKNVTRNYVDMKHFKPPYYFEHFSVIIEFLTGNYIGKVIYKMLTPAWDKILIKKCKENVHVSAVQLLIAMKCYKDKTGELPQSLNELVPEYFERIPEDDFDGRPMRYSAEKKMIYSVGEDLEDSGGSEDDKEWWDLEDPTVKINF